MDQKLYANYGAKGAIETALFDLLRRRFDTPVYSLLGGISEDRFPLSRLTSNSAIEKDTAKVQEHLAEGYRIIKVKVGILPVEEDVERVRAIRDLVGARVSSSRRDPGLGCPHRTQVRAGVENYGLESLEQPTANRNLDGFACDVSLARIWRLEEQPRITNAPPDNLGNLDQL